MLGPTGKPVIGANGVAETQTISIGGKDILTGTVEVERDLPRNFGVAVFADYGNAFDRFGDPLEYAAGFGVRYRLPVLTVGIDLAQPLNRPGRRAAPQHRFLDETVGSCAAASPWSPSSSPRSCSRCRLPRSTSRRSREAGLRFIIERLPGRIGGVRLRFFNVSGTLVDGVRIERLEIDQERVYLRFDDVRARVVLRSLLWQTHPLAAASVHNAYIHVKPHTEEPPSSDPHFLPHGLVIRADALHADAVTLVLASGQRMRRRRSIPPDSCGGTRSAS